MHSGATIFCLRCGNENPAQNRFCGMCGGELVRPRSAESLGDAYGDADPTQPAAPPYYEPAREYPQPSFGYRYADEESHGHWKLYLFAAMVAIAGFIVAYQWGKPNFDTSKILAVLQRPEKKSPAAGEGAAQPAATEAGAAKPETPAGAPPASAPAASPGQPSAGTAPENPHITPPDQNAAPSAGAGADNSKNAGEREAAPGTKGTERGLSEQDIPAGQTGNGSQQPPAAAPTANAAPAEDTNSDETSGEEARVSPPPAAQPRRSASASRKTAPADEAGSAEPQPHDRQQVAANDLLVDTAQNYLYGRGVPRDCDRALSYLRRAADTSARAKTQLGAMYATGQCVPQDRPTAYHWMALAFRSDPRNSYLERDLQMLWSQMTADEKQRALRMTR